MCIMHQFISKPRVVETSVHFSPDLCRQQQQVRTMSSAFEKLCIASTPQIKYTHISDLQQNVPHKIEEFKLLRTKYGLRVIIIIQKDVYFLPARYAKHITEAEDIAKLNSKQYNIIYEGLRDK